MLSDEATAASGVAANELPAAGTKTCRPLPIATFFDGVDKGVALIF